MAIWRKTMWNVHVVDLGKLFLFKIWRVFEKFIQNLTRCKKFISKTDKTKNFRFKIILFTKTCSFKNMLFKNNFFCENAPSKILFSSSKSCLKENFSSKPCFLNMHLKRKSRSDYGVKSVKTWLFCVQIFFKICFLKLFFFFKVVLFENYCFFKIVLFKNNFFFKIWRVVKFLIQNLTRCKNFKSKSAFEIVFSDSRWIFIKVLQTSKNNLLEIEDGLGKRIFLRVCGMSLSHVWYNLFGYCVLYGNPVLAGREDYIICTTNWFIQNSLEFKEWLV